MGFFSRFSSPKTPRWAFQTGWSDFVLALREEAQRYGLRIDDADLAAGVVPLPVTAAYETWDVRPLATHCRDLEPYEWVSQIRQSLHVAFGRAGDVELVGAPPPAARAPRVEPPPTRSRSLQRDRLRVQLFGDGYVRGMKLDRDGIAMHPFGDAWLDLVAHLEANASVQASEWIGTSLWWWPVGAAPEVFTVDGPLPAALAALLA